MLQLENILVAKELLSILYSFIKSFVLSSVYNTGELISNKHNTKCGMVVTVNFIVLLLCILLDKYYRYIIYLFL